MGKRTGDQQRVVLSQVVKCGDRIGRIVDGQQRVRDVLHTAGGDHQLRLCPVVGRGNGDFTGCRDWTRKRQHDIVGQLARSADQERQHAVVAGIAIANGELDLHIDALARTDRVKDRRVGVKEQDSVIRIGDLVPKSNIHLREPADAINRGHAEGQRSGGQVVVDVGAEFVDQIGNPDFDVRVDRDPAGFKGLCDRSGSGQYPTRFQRFDTKKSTTNCSPRLLALQGSRQSSADHILHGWPQSQSGFSTLNAPLQNQRRRHDRHRVINRHNQGSPSPLPNAK